jgi:Cof subfamily protein (haloacid dehalogenase superfamily)
VNRRPINKLIAVDLDGTLVGPDNSISIENISAIRDAGRQGAAVVIVTGRPYASADVVARRVGLPAIPLVAFNGALIRWTDGGEILRNCCVPADLAAEVVEECLDQQLHLHYYLDDEMYVTQLNHWARLYCERNGMSCQVVPDMRRFAGRQPLKLLVIDQPNRINELLQRYRERFRDRLYVTRSMAEYVEFLSPDVSKGRALDWLMEFYGIAREATMAIGDSMNDVPLLQHAGHRVAMPNGDDELKRIAQFVPPEQPTGVAAAVEWFLAR